MAYPISTGDATGRTLTQQQVSRGKLKPDKFVRESNCQNVSQKVERLTNWQCGWLLAQFVNAPAHRALGDSQHLRCFLCHHRIL
jgi:hypothetical protein